MKKELIKTMKVGIIGIIFLFSFCLKVNASGTASVGFSGDASVPLNKNITVKLYVSNVTGTQGGIVSMGGNLNFDSTYLEYVSGTGITTPYTFQINTNASYKIAGLDPTLSNGISSTSQTNVFTFVFKPLKKGSATISFTNGKLTDTASEVTTTITNKTITINDAQNTDATLSSLGVNGLNISPNFSATTTSYTLNVENTTSSITVTASPTASSSNVTGTGNKNLNVGSNIINVKVTAESGATKTYTITVTRAEAPKNTDATLSDLSVSGYTLTPDFNPNTTTYNLTVPSSASTINITANPTSSKSTIAGAGSKTLSTGMNIAEITVTAEDGTTKKYIINITKEAEVIAVKDSDTTLQTLDVSGYTLTPVFNKNTSSYSMTVANNITSLEVIAIPNSRLSTATITGNNDWKIGVNVISIKVTAEDGSEKIYTVNVTRKAATTTTTPTKSNDNYIKTLNINNGELSPKFDSKVNSYSIIIPYEDNTLDLTYVLNNTKAKASITGNNNLKVVGINVVTIEVTAEDGSIRYYTINVTRSAQESDNKLKSLILDKGKLSPTFASETYDYDVEIENNVNNINVTAIAENSKSKVEIIGNKDLIVGNNTILVKVTDEKGLVQYYKINVTKKAKSGFSIFGLDQTGSIIATIAIGLTTLGTSLGFVMLMKPKVPIVPSTTAPVFEIKPEFNFNSNNTSDDDTFYSGNVNQNSELNSLPNNPIELEDKPQYIDANYEEKEAVYDPYDDVVTKDEVIDAIQERDVQKLKILYKQEMLNREKIKIKELNEGELSSEEQPLVGKHIKEETQEMTFTREELGEKEVINNEDYFTPEKELRRTEINEEKYQQD